MGVQWTTKSIQFFRRYSIDDDDNSGRGSSMLEGSPYLSFSFEKDDSLMAAEYLPTQSVRHRYPTRACTSTMLFEIGRHAAEGRQNLWMMRWERLKRKLTTITTILRWPREVKLGRAFRFKKRPGKRTRSIVRNCSNSELFEQTPRASWVKIVVL